MIRIGVALSLLLLSLGCASSGRPGELLQPQVEIRQIGGPGGDGVTRDLQGGMSVKLQVAVMNPSSETIEVDFLEVSSIGEGSFSIPTSQRPVNRLIQSNQFEVIEFWVAAYSGGSIAGSSGPVTLRLMVHFSSDHGTFRELYTQTINTSRRPRSDPQ